MRFSYVSERYENKLHHISIWKKNQEFIGGFFLGGGGVVVFTFSFRQYEDISFESFLFLSR